MGAPRPLVVVLLAIVLAGCTTRTLESGAPTVRTSVGSEPVGAPVSLHGYVEGELLIRFSPDGERAITPWVGKPPDRLRFGVPSLDRLNVKYRATQILPLVGEHGGYILRIATDANVFRAVEEYGHDPLVTGATLNYTYRLPGAQAPDVVRTQVGPLRRDTSPGPPLPH